MWHHTLCKNQNTICQNIDIKINLEYVRKKTKGGGGHSGTEGGRTRVTYFAEEGVFLRPPHVRNL